jgi:hypothetical protein
MSIFLFLYNINPLPLPIEENERMTGAIPQNIEMGCFIHTRRVTMREDLSNYPEFLQYWLRFPC